MMRYGLERILTYLNLLLFPPLISSELSTEIEDEVEDELEAKILLLSRFKQGTCSSAFELSSGMIFLSPTPSSKFH